MSFLRSRGDRTAGDSIWKLCLRVPTELCTLDASELCLHDEERGGGAAAAGAVFFFPGDMGLRVCCLFLAKMAAPVAGGRGIAAVYNSFAVVSAASTTKTSTKFTLSVHF